MEEGSWASKVPFVDRTKKGRRSGLCLRAVYLHSLSRFPVQKSKVIYASKTLFNASLGDGPVFRGNLLSNEKCL